MATTIWQGKCLTHVCVENLLERQAKFNGAKLLLVMLF
jgi:hypothetical protein